MDSYNQLVTFLSDLHRNSVVPDILIVQNLDRYADQAQVGGSDLYLISELWNAIN